MGNVAPSRLTIDLCSLEANCTGYPGCMQIHLHHLSASQGALLDEVPHSLLLLTPFFLCSLLLPFPCPGLFTLLSPPVQEGREQSRNSVSERLVTRQLCEKVSVAATFYQTLELFVFQLPLLFMCPVIPVERDTSTLLQYWHSLLAGTLLLTQCNWPWSIMSF